MELKIIQGIFQAENLGQRPWCLIDFFLTTFYFIDESHATLPQLEECIMETDRESKKLVDFGFRLPSALDNRPLKPEEFNAPTAINICFCDSCPELENSSVVVEQLIRPTGLLDPEMEVRPIKGLLRTV